MGEAVMKAMGSLARNEGAEAVDKLEYMRGSIICSSNRKMLSLSCCDRRV